MESIEELVMYGTIQDIMPGNQDQLTKEMMIGLYWFLTPTIDTAFYQ